MQIFAMKKMCQKSLKIRFGRVLGSIWEGLREVVGGVWSLLGFLGPFFALTFLCLFLEWSSKVLSEASGVDLGSILRGLARTWGGFWEGFGADFEGF